MTIVELPALDRQILQELKTNRRIEDSELAEKLDVLESVVSERIKWLEDHSFIFGYTTKINFEALDLPPDELENFKETIEGARPKHASQSVSSKRRN